MFGLGYWGGVFILLYGSKGAGVTGLDVIGIVAL